MGRPCACCGTSSYVIISCIDESTPYHDRHPAIYDEDLRDIRKFQEVYGEFPIIILNHLPTARFLTPNNRPLPSEVEVFNAYKHGGYNVDIYREIAERYIFKRAQGACVGVSIDTSGSTRESFFRNGLDCFYYNLSGGVTTQPPFGQCNKYLDNNLVCKSGFWDKANGCVREKKFGNERWLREALTQARLLDSEFSREDRHCQYQKSNWGG
jgi:hypothetical protein